MNTKNQTNQTNQTNTLKKSSRMQMLIDSFSGMNETVNQRTVNQGKTHMRKSSFSDGNQFGSTTVVLPQSKSLSKIETVSTVVKADIKKTGEDSSNTTSTSRERSLTGSDYTNHGTFILPENRDNQTSKNDLNETQTYPNKDEIKDSEENPSKPQGQQRSNSFGNITNSFKTKAKQFLKEVKNEETTTTLNHSEQLKELDKIKEELKKEFGGIDEGLQKKFIQFCKNGKFFILKRKYIDMLQKGEAAQAVKDALKGDFLLQFKQK